MFGHEIDKEPAWSPDGATIAYVHFLRGLPNSLTPTLYLYDLASRTYRSLGVSGREPDWHPDGKRLAYTCIERTYRGICELHIETGRIRHLTPNSWAVQPDWSPDGASLIYRNVDGPPSQVWEVNANDSASAAPSKATLIGGAYPRWVSQHQIVAVSYAPRTFSPGTAHTSPEEVILVDFRTGAGVFLTNDGAIDRHLVVSPTGKIAWTTDVGGTPSLWTMDLNGSNKKPLPSGFGVQPSWSHDGKSIVFYGQLSPAVPCVYTLMTINADGTGLSVLTPPEIYPDVPPIDRSCPPP